MKTHQVRLQSGVIGELSTTLKPRELLGRPVLIKAEIGEETVSVAGIVVHVFEQGQLAL